ncbi:MAG: hypothetical protein PHI98_15355 [Eubacteriales bacterium]|nr:hypothetical protein [Eubacteriales bacterium]
MSTKALAMRTAKRYGMASGAVLLFAAVYEANGYGVYSPFMVLLFLWPLLLGAIPFFILSRWKRSFFLGWLPRCLYHSGVATLTTGSAVSGILEIYGTASPYTVVYWVVGGLLLVSGGTLLGLQLLAKRKVGH